MCASVRVWEGGGGGAHVMGREFCLDVCMVFFRMYFISFRKSSPEQRLFCYFHKWNPLWEFGLGLPLNGVLVTIFVMHSFFCFNDLKRNTTTTMAPTMVSFDLALCVVSIYPHRLLAFRQNVRPGEGSVPTGPTTGKLQSLMTSRAEKGTQDLSVDAW